MCNPRIAEEKRNFTCPTFKRTRLSFVCRVPDEHVTRNVERPVLTIGELEQMHVTAVADENACIWRVDVIGSAYVIVFKCIDRWSL